MVAILSLEPSDIGTEDELFDIISLYSESTKDFQNVAIGNFIKDVIKDL